MNELSSTGMLSLFFICPLVREHLGGPGSSTVYSTAVGTSTEKLESVYNFYEHVDMEAEFLSYKIIPFNFFSAL